ncbi:MAG TPA: hypothetical protein VH309_06765, partial [Elusimicrobiota bacterium]|nr:hypothetical protein [Elusimicrobiota bacterium]
MFWERIPGSYTSDKPQVMTMMWGCGGWEENYLVLMTWTGNGWRREFGIPRIGHECRKLAKKGARDALICESAESKGGVEREGYDLLTFPKDRLDRQTLLNGFWTSGNENVVRDPTACSTILPAD